MCSIFSKNLHNTTLRVCDWEGPLRCINSSTQRREGNLMNRVPCMKARVTSLLYTAFSFSSSLYSVAVPCACYSECILLTETSWVKMACPLPPTTRIRDHQLNNEFPNKYLFSDWVGFASDVLVNVACFLDRKEF